MSSGGRRGFRTGLFAIACSASWAEGQRPEVPMIWLDRPIKEFPLGFSWLTSLRELPDGRVMVLEQCEAVVMLLDFATGRAAMVGRTGSGPKEYRSAGGLLALPGDSSAIWDYPNMRYLLIDQRGEPTRLFPGIPSLTTRSGRYAVGSPFTVYGTDARGRFYGRQSGKHATPKGIVDPDSVPIERWDPSSGRRDTVAFHRTARSGLNIPVAPPFAPATVWALSSAGGIAVVFPADYHVEFISPAGARTIGRPNPWQRIPVDASLKEEWRADQEPVCTSFSSRNRAFPIVENGETRLVKGGTTRNPKDWPVFLPPFLRQAASYAPDGTLWIARTGPAGGPQVYDLIDSTGRVSRHVVLPHRARLLGFGKERIYITRKDEDDLQYVQVFSSIGIQSKHPRPRP